MTTLLRTLIKPDRWPAFARGMLAYGSAEAATRAVRLATILVVARQISPATLGVAALALSLFELVRVLTNAGVGQRIIIATQDELEGVCRTALRLFWTIAAGVMAMQLALAALLWAVFDLGEVAGMLAALALVYGFMPAGQVQIFLAMRAQRMAATAGVAATQNIADSLLTLALVIIWPSAWAIVLPKLLTAPVWLVLARRTYSWLPDRAVNPAPMSDFRNFGPAILASEMLTAARLHADKLIVGALLGTEALGLYYFAFNAGLGITQSLVAACNLVLFPHLAKLDGADLEREFRSTFLRGFAVFAPIIAAQVVLAPVYVPVVFGENWIEATPYIALLACAALPLLSGSLIAARHRAAGAPFAETRLMAMATLASLTGLALGCQISLAAACAGFGAGLALVLIPAAFPFIICTTRPTILTQGDSQ
ncbi:MAG: oligosaccharide flippase family protein [Pseudomonadota bacterium]